MKRVLVIDALNMFLRAFIVDPSLSQHGQPIGGIKGSIKILQKLVRITKPNEIVICWDGPNGSQKRKTLDSGYKEGRKPLRLNRSVHNLTENEEIQNKVWQQMQVIEYFNQMPIIQLILERVEADDIISYVCNSRHYDGWQKVIVSNDKDFLQLCDDETVVYRPTTDKIETKKTVIESLGIHPTNMALARAMDGDASDNLPGVNRVGMKTIATKLPFMKEERSVTIDELIEYCETKESKLKVFKTIAESRKLIEHNYDMMQLYSPLISVQGKQTIDYALDNFECDFNKTELLRLMVEDGFGELNWEELKTFLNKISRECCQLGQ
jgi:DNA polymerase-1